jgi:hypothetical protein
MLNQAAFSVTIGIEHELFADLDIGHENIVGVSRAL